MKVTELFPKAPLTFPQEVVINFLHPYDPKLHVEMKLHELSMADLLCLAQKTMESLKDWLESYSDYLSQRFHSRVVFDFDSLEENGNSFQIDAEWYYQGCGEERETFYIPKEFLNAPNKKVFCEKLISFYEEEREKEKQAREKRLLEEEEKRVQAEKEKEHKIYMKVKAELEADLQKGLDSGDPQPFELDKFKEQAREKAKE